MREARGGEVALIVEDEARFRGLLADVVRDMGCVAETAADAEEALRAARERAPDLVVLDLNLPRVNGLEFLDRFRQRWPDAPVGIITGHGDLNAAREAIRLGVTDFLTKPCDLGQIEAAIDRARRRVVRPNPGGSGAMAPGLVPPLPDGPTAGVGKPAAPPEVRPLDEVERDAILEALRVTGGNRSAAARRLGISRRAIYNKLEAYRSQGHQVP